MPETKNTRSVYMNITQDFSSAPSSNTGSLLQITSKLDWLQGLLTLPNTALQPFINATGALFRDSFEPDRGQKFCGRSFDHHTVSDRHCLIAWNFLDDNICEVLLMLPAKFLAGCPSVNLLLGFYRDLASYKFRPTRIDLAIDDFTKSLTYELFDAAFDADLAHGFKTVDYRAPKSKLKDCGFTYYMGASGSDKKHRFYNKSVESGGEIDAYRLECQFKDDWCKGVWKFLSFATESNYHQYIVDFVVNCIDFYSVDDDKNKIRLDWWQNFLTLCKAGTTSLSCGRIKPSIQQTIDWIETQVEASLANVEAFYDRIGGDFLEWLNARLESGRSRLTKSHLNKVAGGLALLNIGSHVSPSEIAEGFF